MTTRDGFDDLPGIECPTSVCRECGAECRVHTDLLCDDCWHTARLAVTVESPVLSDRELLALWERTRNTEAA